MPASPELLPLVSHTGQACGRHCSDYHSVSQASAPALASFRQHQLSDHGTAQVPPSPPHSFLWTQHCVDQGGLTHTILLTLPPRCWSWDRRQHHSWQEWTFLPGCFFLNQDPLSPETSSSPPSLSSILPALTAIIHVPGKLALVHFSLPRREIRTIIDRLFSSQYWGLSLGVTLPSGNLSLGYNPSPHFTGYFKAVLLCCPGLSCLSRLGAESNPQVHRFL